MRIFSRTKYIAKVGQESYEHLKNYLECAGQLHFADSCDGKQVIGSTIEGTSYVAHSDWCDEVPDA